jgi:predicted helicase
LSDNCFTPFKNSFLFKSIDETTLLKYNEGINPISLFKVNVMGFQTHRDNFCIDENKNILTKRLYDFSQSEFNEESIFKTFGVKSSSDFDIKNAQIELSKANIKEEIIQCAYRPFEKKFIYFDRIVVDRPRKELVTNVKNKENLLLGIGRQGLAVGDIDWCLTTVSKHPVDANIFRRGGVNLFPLYLYPDNSGQQTIEQTTERQPNLNTEIVNQIASKIGLTFTNEKQNTENTFAPIDIVDYIYAVLHSPTYREKYKEFLKTDFPRIPFPKNADTFWQLVKLGGEIRKIHLLESPTVDKYITQYPIDGDNVVVKPKYENGKVYINDTQYFDNVPEIAWEFYIGGYQPAQKWLKDRKERKLEFEDILHYQKIIVALTETDRLMNEIKKIDIE